MKTPITYGAYIAIASALLTLVMFLLGYHSDPEKLQSSGMISMALGLLIGIAGLVFAIKARRAEYPAHEDFTYGRALAAGVLTGLFASVFSGVFQALYIGVINPNFVQVVEQQQAASMGSASSEQLEAVAKFNSFMFHPAVQFAQIAIVGTIINTIISLVLAAFLKRPAAAPLPPEVPVT